MSLSAVFMFLLNTFRDGDFHFPGQPITMFDHPLSEETLPNIQCKPPLMQLETVRYGRIQSVAKIW